MYRALLKRKIKMSSLDDLLESINKLGQKLSFEGRRTANLARLKIDLKGLDMQRREVLTRLGEKVFDLKKRMAIKDEGLLESLVEQFNEMHDIEKKIEKILDEIHNITLMHEKKSEPAQNIEWDNTVETQATGKNNTGNKPPE